MFYRKNFIYETILALTISTRTDSIIFEGQIELDLSCSIPPKSTVNSSIRIAFGLSMERNQKRNRSKKEKINQILKKWASKQEECHHWKWSELFRLNLIILVHFSGFQCLIGLFGHRFSIGCRYFSLQNVFRDNFLVEVCLTTNGSFNQMQIAWPVSIWFCFFFIFSYVWR